MWLFILEQKTLIFIIFVLFSWDRLFYSESETFDIPETKFKELRVFFEDQYPIDEHIVTTKDGYILTLFRIRSLKQNEIPLLNNKEDNQKQPIYMHHALALDASAWFWSISNNVALPLTLADAGYDVWLGNSRGNYHSCNHIDLNYKSSKKYWNFTWHEIGTHDLPAVIDYILSVTNSEHLHYVGHSQGTAAFFVLMNEYPEYNEKIYSFHGLTPPIFMKNTSSPYVTYLAKKFGEPNLENTKQSEKPSPIILHTLSKLLAKFCKFFQSIRFCTRFYAHIFGSDGFHIDEETAINIFESCPQGAPLKSVVHYMQIISTGRFRKYNYGEVINLKKYGAVEPPDYDIKKITCPVFLYFSQYDLFNSYSGNIRLSNTIRPEALRLNYTVPLKYGFNHLDFIHGKSARDLIFPMILNGIMDMEKEFKNKASAV